MEVSSMWFKKKQEGETVKDSAEGKDSAESKDSAASKDSAESSPCSGTSGSTEMVERVEKDIVVVRPEGKIMGGDETSTLCDTLRQLMNEGIMKIVKKPQHFRRNVKITAYLLQRRDLGHFAQEGEGGLDEDQRVVQIEILR